MISQLLGKYFVEKGLLTETAFSKIIDAEESAHVKLGTIAVADKYLTEEQAEEINHLQMSMDRRFGDIAIEKGYLTGIQLDELLSKQGSPYMKFLQNLVESGQVTLSKIDTCISDFQKEYGFSNRDMEALKKDDIDAILPIFAPSAKPYVTDLAGLVLRNITRFVSSNYYIGKMKRVEQLSYKHLAGQKSIGTHTMYLGLAATEAASNSETGLTCLASGFAGESMTAMTDECYDSLCEFINVTSGLFASDLSTKYIEMDMQPPFVYKDQTAVGHAYALPIFLKGQEITLYLAVDEEIRLGDKPYSYASKTENGSNVTGFSKGTVVIVDDSRMSRTVLRNVLEEDGFTVIAEAVNGAEGVAAYEKYKPDAITLDITMPVMDGLEALQKIMESDPKAVAVMISAAGQQRKIVEAIKLGAAKFIVKPFKKSEVIKTMNEIL